MPSERGGLISLATVIGLTAGVCTTLANLPQLIKAWSTRETDDISLKTLLLLGCGLIPVSLAEERRCLASFERGEDESP